MNTGKIVFVSGLSGSGKTTLGERFKTNNGWVHFNVDVWAFGGDPINESDQVPNPAMMAKRDPEIQSAFDNMMVNGFRSLANGIIPDFVVWENFFSKLIPVIQQFHENNPTKDLIVTFSVYLQSIRDYLRNQIRDLIFIVLNPSVDNVATRKIQHLRNTATSRNQTLSQFLRSFNPDSDAPEMEESAIVDLFTAQTRAGSVGFEPANNDEIRTIGISGDKTIDEVHNEALTFIATI